MNPELRIIGVQFNPVGKIYHFSAPAGEPLEVGYYVVVNTSRGKQLGKVKVLDVPNPQNVNEIQPIERAATSKDLMLMDMISEKEDQATAQVREFLKKSRFHQVKMMDAEYSFDSTRLTLYLHYEPDSGFDIKGFLREVSPLFRDVRLEIRQVGPRDMAKFVSGLGACGIEKRCCSRFLTEFSSISIKMAKSQDISLTPEEITGICGRLRCCLNYEYEQYEEARKSLPKRKKVIQTPLGQGQVVQVLPLSNAVVVDIPESGPHKFTQEELETGIVAQKPEAKPEAAEKPDELSGDVEYLRLDDLPKAPKPPAPKEINAKGGRSGKDAGSQGGWQPRQQNRREDSRTSAKSEPTRSAPSQNRPTREGRGQSQRHGRRQDRPFNASGRTERGANPERKKPSEPGSEPE